MNCLAEIKEINSFQNVCLEIKSETLPNYSTQLQLHAIKIKKKMLQSLERCRGDDNSLSKAKKLATEL
jgi:hypothetical protein